MLCVSELTESDMCKITHIPQEDERTVLVSLMIADYDTLNRVVYRCEAVNTLGQVFTECVVHVLGLCQLQTTHGV